MKTVEVSFSPLLYNSKLTKNDFNVVIVDIFRATTSITAALAHGVKSVIPVEGIEAAKEFRKNGYTVACERDGKVLDFADTGNSPSDFLQEEFKDKAIAFSTTNGTKAVKQAVDAENILAGSFINLSSVGEWLILDNRNVVIFCAAWKNLFNLEDAVFAGALSEILLNSGQFLTECDSVKASLDLWSAARADLKNYLSKSSHRNRLKHLVSDEDYNFTTTIDCVKVTPVIRDGRFVDEPK